MFSVEAEWSKPETLNPIPQTLNPKPQTLNPEATKLSCQQGAHGSAQHVLKQAARSHRLQDLATRAFAIPDAIPMHIYIYTHTILTTIVVT